MSRRPSIGRDGRVAAAEHVHCRQFDGDLVMVDLQGGEYFALDDVGARMWDLLNSGKSPAEIGRDLATEYEADEDKILGDCMKLADELLERGLVVVRAP